MASAKLRFLFDYISHNAYLAWTQVHGLCERHGLMLEPVPVLFAGFLKTFGQLGPAEIPAKRLWMLRDCLRKADRLGVALNPPASHPFNPLLPLRVTCVDMQTDERKRLIDLLFAATWVRGLDVSQADVVRRIADEAGLDGDRLVTEANGDAARAALRHNTDQAIGAGAFGVPTMLVGPELFWGLDDFAHLDRYLAGADTLDDARFEPWRQVEPSATRF